MSSTNLSTDKPVFLNEEDVKKLLTWETTYKAIEAALKKVGEKRAVQNPRDAIQVLNSNSILLTMPGYLQDAQFGGLGCKLVGVFPENKKLAQPLPTIIANIVLLDETRGHLKAIVAGTEITRWRTAAASAVATKYLHLRNPSRKCEILAVLGAGAQGDIHARAFHHFFKFREIRVWNRNSERAVSLVAELNETVARGVFKAYSDNQECVRDADVIITATFASQPIVKLDWVKPGVHINAVGAGTNHYSELDEALYLGADVFVDSWDTAKGELAGLLTLGAKVRGDVGGVIIGDLELPEDKRITVFQGVGMAVEDCAMARMVYDLHMEC